MVGGTGFEPVTLPCETKLTIYESMVCGAIGKNQSLSINADNATTRVITLELSQICPSQKTLLRHCYS